MAGKGYSGSLPPARGPSALRKGELVHRRNAQKGCQRALCWPTSASGRAGNEGQKRGRAPPPGEKLTPVLQDPAWGPAEDRAAQSAVLRHPTGRRGQLPSLELPVCICVGRDTQAPKLTLRVSWLPTLTALWLEGGGSAQAWCSRSPVSGPLLPSQVASCPAGQTLPSPREEQFTLSLSLHPWQPRERFSLLPSGHFSERSSGRAKASFVEESGVPGPGSSVTSHGDPPLRPSAGSHPGLEPS